MAVEVWSHCGRVDRRSLIDLAPSIAASCRVPVDEPAGESPRSLPASARKRQRSTFISPGNAPIWACARPSPPAPCTVRRTALLASWIRPAPPARRGLLQAVLRLRLTGCHQLRDGWLKESWCRPCCLGPVHANGRSASGGGAPRPAPRHQCNRHRLIVAVPAGGVRHEQQMVCAYWMQPCPIGSATGASIPPAVSSNTQSAHGERHQASRRQRHRDVQAVRDAHGRTRVSLRPRQRSGGPQSPPRAPRAVR